MVKIIWGNKPVATVIMLHICIFLAKILQQVKKDLVYGDVYVLLFMLMMVNGLDI